MDILNATCVKFNNDNFHFGNEGHTHSLGRDWVFATRKLKLFDVRHIVELWLIWNGMSGTGGDYRQRKCFA